MITIICIVFLLIYENCSTLNDHDATRFILVAMQIHELLYEYLQNLLRNQVNGHGSLMNVLKAILVRVM